ncbi:MAG: glycosyltransferase [Alphaproteobacteria bacterium]|nr:glycosyltransferase [Alphaproteobacteria bacterium]
MGRGASAPVEYPPVQSSLSILDALLLAPVVGGSVFSVLSSAAVYAFARRRARWPAPPLDAAWPSVSLLKPVHGLERDLERNLRTAVAQDYPEYEVVYSAQRTNDPALPILEAIAREEPRARLAVAESEPVVNGKVQNMAIGYAASRNAVIVISDSDVRLEPDYLKAVVAPLLDPKVGYVCTFYRATGAQRWFEKIELLTLNGEFGVQLVFAHMTGASDFCLGASTALRRETLDRIGGMAPLGDYLVEDYEMGKRIRALGLAPVLVPRHVDMTVDLKSAGDAWRHLVYWDQNTKAARPWGFLATGLTRAVPFALAFAALDGFGATGLTVLAVATAFRVATTAFNLKLAFDDREGLRALPWLPVRDLVALTAWLAALTKRSFVWRGLEFGLTREGRIVPRQLPS